MVCQAFGDCCVVEEEGEGVVVVVVVVGCSSVSFVYGAISCLWLPLDLILMLFDVHVPILCLFLNNFQVSVITVRRER